MWFCETWTKLCVNNWPFGLYVVCKQTGKKKLLSFDSGAKSPARTFLLWEIMRKISLPWTPYELTS